MDNTENQPLPTKAHGKNTRPKPKAPAKPKTSEVSSAPASGLFQDPEEGRKHVLTQRQRRAEFIKAHPDLSEVLPAFASEYDVQVSMDKSMRVAITPVGWVGDPQISFGAHEIDDVIKALQKLKKNL